MSGWRTAALVVRRELALERAGREASVTVAPYVAALLLAAGLGFDAAPRVLAATGPGMVWLAVLVAAVPLARGVAAAERAEGGWDLLRGLCGTGALVAGKVTALWLQLAAVWALATVLAAALLGAPVGPAAAFAGGLGTLAVAAVTAVFGLLLAGETRRPALLAVLVIPAALPALLAGTQAGSATSPWPWLALLAAFDAVLVTVTWAVVPVLLEE